MSRFDLSQAADFSRLTQQSLGSVGALFGIDSPQEWNIQEGSYNGVLFHIFKSKSQYQAALSSIDEEFARRKVKYEFPYRDGQTSDDLGAKASSMTMDIVIHGLRYKTGLKALLREFNKPTPGTLIHPIYGSLNVIVESAKITHRSDSRKAVALSVTFTEQSFTIGAISQLEDRSVKSALASALEIFAIVDQAIARVEAAQLLVRAVKNRINSFLDIFKRKSAQSLANMNVTFNTKGGSADIPNLLPVNRGGTLRPDGSVVTDQFVGARSVSDPFLAIPVDDLEPAEAPIIAIGEIEKEVIDLRSDLAQIIQEIEDNGAALELSDIVIELRRTAVLHQDVLETGIASSNALVRDFTIPWTMSLREAAFLNDISPDRMEELDLLNPSLLSTNFIEKETVIKVPVL